VLHIVVGDVARSRAVPTQIRDRFRRRRRSRSELVREPELLGESGNGGGADGSGVGRVRELADDLAGQH
jgi:hypothetical protein